MRRSLTVIAAGVVATFLVAGPAAAHVGVSPTEAPSGGYERLAFSVPHGCDGAATNEIAVAIPPGVVSVKPEFVVGWDATTEVGPYDEPVTLHGEELTEGVVSVTWTAQEGSELPDDQFREFGLSVKLPEGDPGTMLAFPVVQGCVEGAETAWITVPEGDEEPEHPAPVVRLMAAGDGHADGDDEAAAEPADTAVTDAAETTGTEAEGTEADGTGTGASADGAALAETDDAGVDALALAALAVALLGLGFGVGSWVAVRRGR